MKSEKAYCVFRNSINYYHKQKLSSSKLQINNYNTQNNIYINSNSNPEDFDNLDFDKEDNLTGEEKEQIINGKAMVIVET